MRSPPRCAGVIAFLVSDAAAPVSGAILARVRGLTRRHARTGANHHDPVMLAHLAGGEPGLVSQSAHSPPGVPERQGRDVVTTPADGAADLPDYAPIPRSALGPALNEQGYHVGRVERNLFWVTDGVYQSAFLATSDGVVLSTHRPASGTTCAGLSTRSRPPRASATP